MPGSSVKQLAQQDDNEVLQHTPESLQLNQAGTALQDANNNDRNVTPLQAQDEADNRDRKRPRLSPPQEDQEEDFEVAAARALAISLGVNATKSPSDIAPSNSASVGARPISSSGSVRGHGSVDCTVERSSSDKRKQECLSELSQLSEAAASVLTFLSKLNHLEIGEMLFEPGPPSRRRLEYQSIKSRFEELRKPYTTNSPFVAIPQLGLEEAEQLDTFRKTNLATFMAGIFSGEIGLRIMDIHFIDVFVPQGGRLLKAQGSIYLELKTQAFMAAVRTAPQILDQVMLDLFPANVDQQLLRRRAGAKSLAPSEQDFIQRLRSRRDILYDDMKNKRLGLLVEKYRWNDFSREVSAYLTRFMNNRAVISRSQLDTQSPEPEIVYPPQSLMESQFELLAELPPTGAITALTGLPGDGLDAALNFSFDDFAAHAARAADIAMGNPLNSTSMAQTAVNPPLNQQLDAPVVKSGLLHARSLSPSQGHHVELELELMRVQSKKDQTDDPQKSNEVPHSSQTAPTQVLYDRARQATNAIAPPTSRKMVPPSQRRPWTTAEEHALMTGLDQVKGPHWSQILAMYGPGGTINESLKDRNQVQLKDKARNLKLFFLKAGIEVPYYLQQVTGDLKTRGPGQAEKIDREKGHNDNAGFELDHQCSHDGEDDMTGIGNGHAINLAGDLANDETTKDLQVSNESEIDLDAMLARAAAKASQV